MAEREVATLGGGCFWCLEAVFEQLRGVESVVSGYAGGHVPNPTYEQVCGKGTGHAEVVQVTFDPAVVSYREVLEVFFATHDPTTKDRQGNDVGPQYRSAIFTHSDEQKKTAEGLIAEWTDGGGVPEPDRHRGDAGHGVLPGRGLPPGVLPRQPGAAVLHVRGRPEGGQVPQAVRATKARTRPDCTGASG